MTLTATTSATGTWTRDTSGASGGWTDMTNSPQTSRAPADRGAAPATTWRTDHGGHYSPGPGRAGRRACLVGRRARRPGGRPVGHLLHDRPRHGWGAAHPDFRRHPAVDSRDDHPGCTVA